MSGLDAELDVTAAEHALGLLEGDEHDGAERRGVHEADFAQAVARWSYRFAALANVRPVAPPASAWSRLEAALDHGAATAGVSRWWRPAALSGFAVAAALLLVIVDRPIMAPPIAPPTAPARVLGAVLVGPTGAGSVTVSYEPSTRRLMTLPVRLTISAGRAAELWVIPAGGTPIALWIVDPARPSSHIVSGPAIAALERQATLAVSIEPPGGSATGQPTGPVILSGSASAA